MIILLLSLVSAAAPPLFQSYEIRGLHSVSGQTKKIEVRAEKATGLQGLDFDSLTQPDVRFGQTHGVWHVTADQGLVRKDQFLFEGHVRLEWVPAPATHSKPVLINSVPPDDRAILDLATGTWTFPSFELEFRGKKKRGRSLLVDLECREMKSLQPPPFRETNTRDAVR